MRAIAAVLLLLFVAGCGPSRAELIATYEAELRELQRIEAEIQSHVDKYDSHVKEITSLTVEGLKLKKNLTAEDVEKAGEEDKKHFQKIWESIERQIDGLKPKLEAQKLRVEAARKAKDAAGE